jgi:hypothetical protein
LSTQVQEDHCMKSLQNYGTQPAGLPILADDVLEFHAARILLLFKHCGVAGRIDGLTKMAKLDFFVRYPQFFEELCAHLGVKYMSPTYHAIESSMVRFHYGPWDKRYYHVLSYLEAKGLLSIERAGSTYVFKLTTDGQEIAKRAEKLCTYASLVQQMKQVKVVLGGKSGYKLKEMVYEVFGEEVADRPLGELIE